MAELKTLKASYKDTTGEDFDPPAPTKEKKKKEAAAPAADDGPSKNELKKAAKEAEKAAKKAAYKAGGAAESPKEAAAGGKAAAAGGKADKKPAAAAAAAAAGTSGGAEALVGATLVCHASTGLVCAAALSLADPALLAGLAVQASAPAGELARLVLAGGRGQVVGPHAVARLVAAVGGGGAAGSSPLAAALADQWLDLAAMYCADEQPFLATLEAGLVASGGKRRAAACAPSRSGPLPRGSLFFASLLPRSLCHLGPSPLRLLLARGGAPSLA